MAMLAASGRRTEADIKTPSVSTETTIPGLHVRNVDTYHSKNAAQGHDCDERHGNRPNGTSTHLSRPQSNGDHRTNVVHATKRVSHAVEKSTGFADSDMRMGQGWGHQRR